MDKRQALPLVALYFCLVTLSQFCSIVSSKTTGFSLKLIPKNSPESPLYPGNITYAEKIEKFFRFSGVRRHYLKNLSRPNAMAEPADDLYMPADEANYHYFVLTEIGSRATESFLLLDTGGSLSWTQCRPCKNCYSQDYPIYNSRTSDSYRSLSCDHPFCSEQLPGYRCQNNKCTYKIRYGDGSSTRGVASVEQFKFYQSQSSTVVLQDIVFGCSNDNRNFKWGEIRVISGLLGLNKSPDSLISQLSNLVNHRFSYCFPPFRQLDQDYGKLRFGDAIPPPSENAKTTRLVTPAGSYHYFMNLLDISIRAVRQGFQPRQFQFRQDGSGGFLLDSGTTFTKIDRTVLDGFSAYDYIMASFRMYYNAQNLLREIDGPLNLELCYECPPGYNDLANMTFHFEGGDYHVEPQYVHFPDDLSVGFFCIAIWPADGESILGLWQQQNMRLTYDGNIDGLQFAPEDCMNDIH